MLTEQELLNIANNYINKTKEGLEDNFIIINEATIKKPYGSIFFYTSKKFYETNDDRYALAGNAPFLVENESGNIITFGSSKATEDYIEEYEAGKWSRG